MRMEELSDNRYVKGTDTVERYLLNLVQEYFKNSNIASTTSREYIIKRAVERMKEEITFDSIGVLSVTLPDGEVRTGAVTITLEDLNGEPLISPKLSAFNVNFGTEQNTACEGNDPRLSDARKPLEHEHEISDIKNLEGILSTLTGKIERVNGFLHTHDNTNVLDILVYTGDNTTIDLADIENIEDEIIRIVEEIRSELVAYRQEISDKVTAINQEIANINGQIANIRQYILDTNKEYYDLSKAYTDIAIENAQVEINAMLDTLITAPMLSDVLEVANNVYTFAGSMEFDLNSVINFNGSNNQSVTVDIDSNLLSTLAGRKQSLKDCQIEIVLQYLDITLGSLVYSELPYVIIQNNLIDGSIQVGTIYDTNKILVSFDSTSMNVSEEIQDARVIYRVYSKQEVTLR